MYNLYIHYDVSLISSYNDKCFRPSCRENQNTNFMLISSSKIVPFWDNEKKNVVQPDRTQMAI